MLTFELGVIGLKGLDNTRFESRLASIVRGDTAGDGIGVAGIPYG